VPPHEGGLATRRPFSKAHKVRRHADFQRIQAPSSRSGRATTAHFVFLVGSSTAPAGSPGRLGLVVTKKVGSAVERNRVKRLCRECFRLWPAFVPPGIDLLVIARMGAPSLGYAEVRAEWSQVAPALGHRVREVLARGATQPHVSARHTSRAGNPGEGGDPPA
jgi:ribonuclease P protein component